MRTIDDIPMSCWPSPLPLDITPVWLRLFGRPIWRFWFPGDVSPVPMDAGWIYLTASQYARIFRRHS